MAIASLKDLYFDELGDLYDAEMQMLRTLPRLAEAARAAELREALKRHYDESRLHLERLELIFTHWGERRRGKPCAGVAGIVQEADERLNDAATDDVRDAAIIGAAQRIEHYEIAGYGCARTYARRLNRLDEARLLQETLDEEGRADRRLTDLAQAHINDDARAESDFGTPSVRPLAHVPIEEVERQRGSREPITIRTADGDELGVVDGLIVERERGRPRYVVVNAGGLVTHRRYLLPLNLLRFDERAGALRAQIAKEVAERYPAFDRDEFETMSQADRGRYEARVLALLSRDSGAASADAGDAVGTLPEWLLKSTWITVPPAYADRLPDQAREFVNEFAPLSSDAPPSAGSERMVAQDRDSGGRMRHDEETRRANGEKLQ
jgi:ferritin-like metal-binding protein YciE